MGASGWDYLVPYRPEVAEEILTEMGLDPSIAAAAMADPTTGEEVAAEHETVVSKGGFGVPTLVFDDGQALFGPVLVDPPSGKDAVHLWELVTGRRLFDALMPLELGRRISSGDIPPPRSVGAKISAALEAIIGAVR